MQYIMKPKIKKENEKEKHNDRSYKRNPREDNYTLEENIHTFLEKNTKTLIFCTRVGKFGPVFVK